MEKKKNEKQIYKYFYWEFTSEQNKLDNNSRSSNNATRETKRMWLYFFFVVFSPNFITGFPWQRVDNVTKFQLFTEQLPLLCNSLSPTPPTLSLYSTDSNYLLSFGQRLRLRLEPKRKPQRDVPQNSTAKLHQLARRIDAPRGRRLCGSMQSPPLSLSLFWNISVPLPCLEETPVQRERQRILSIIIHSLRMQIELDLICCPTTTNCAHNFACTAPDWHLPPTLLCCSI